MKIAIPIANGKLTMHFGHCQSFVFLEANEAEKSVQLLEELTPPPHEPGVLPRWLGEQKVDVIIAGGMGQRAQQLFSGQGIQVIVGAPAEEPEALAKAFLNGTLQSGANACDH